MIQKPQNWESVQAFTENTPLPVDAYVCKVNGVRVEDNSYGSVLVIAFDIVEGEQAGYYRKQFDANTNANKKWRGTFRQWLPRNDGSEKDETTKRMLKGMVTSFEQSNIGYQWNWNETSLIGKTVGILYREEEYEVEGRHGWSARPFRMMSADRVRSGDYTIPEKRPLRSDAYEAPNTASGNDMAATFGGNFTAVDTADDLSF